MKNIKVIFYSNDGKRNSFSAIFKSERIMDKFIFAFQYQPGYLIFEYDVITDNCHENLPLIALNKRDFRRVYDALYPNLKKEE